MATTTYHLVFLGVAGGEFKSGSRNNPAYTKGRRGALLTVTTMTNAL
jgi:hypothetical protein